MEICPLCNGMIPCYEICDHCGQEMDEIGKMEDFFGPYSPYVEKDLFSMDNHALHTGDQNCIHIVECKLCGRHDYIPVPLRRV